MQPCGSSSSASLCDGLSVCWPTPSLSAPGFLHRRPPARKQAQVCPRLGNRLSLSLLPVARMKHGTTGELKAPSRILPRRKQTKAKGKKGIGCPRPPPPRPPVDGLFAETRRHTAMAATGWSFLQGSTALVASWHTRPGRGLGQRLAAKTTKLAWMGNFTGPAREGCLEGARDGRLLLIILIHSSVASPSAPSPEAGPEVGGRRRWVWCRETKKKDSRSSYRSILGHG